MTTVNIILCLLCIGAESLPGPRNADSLLARAHAIALTGSPDDAKRLYFEAERQYEKSGDLAGQATVYVHLSDLAVRTAQPREAKQHREDAYRLFQKAGKGYSQAMTLRELGLLTATSGECSEAAEMLDHSARMFDYLDAPGQSQFTRVMLLGVLTSDPELDSLRIIRCARKVLAAGDVQAAPESRACAYSALGCAYHYLGDYETALACCEKAEEHLKARQIPDALRTKLEEVVQANRAAAMTYLGRAAEAAEIQERLAEARVQRDDDAKAALSFVNAAVAWRYAQDLDRAESCLEAAEQVTSGRELPCQVAATLELNRGRIQAERGRPDDACEHYKRALTHLPKTSQDCWRFHYFFALALEDLGRVVDAEEHLYTSIRRCEENRGRASEFRQRAAYYESRGDAFAQLVSLLMKQGNAEKAIEVVERHKARCFLDLLPSSSVPSRRAVPLGLGVTGSLMEFTIESATIATDERTRGFGLALQKEKVKSEQNSHETLANVATQPKDHLPAARQPRKLKAIQSALKSDEAILEYYLCSDVGHGFLVTSSDVQSWSFRPGREGVGSVVRQWRHEVEIRRAKKLAEYSTGSESTLFNWVLSPVWNRLAKGDIKTIYVVGDGPLHYVPIAALRNEHGDRLLNHVAVAHVPSASSFVALSEKQTSGTLESVLVVANPKNDLPPLPFAQQEARAVQQHFREQRVLTGKLAHKKAVLEAMPDRDVILFATHGKMKPFSPTQSCLFLAGEAENPDSQLTVSEIAKMHLRTRLAVLSACESGLAGGRTQQFPKGDDVEGMARAFMLAGVPTVLGTLWLVPDRTSANLIEDFIRKVRGDRLNPAEALRQAQVVLLNRSEDSDAVPYHWAGFCVYGLSR